MQNAADNLLTHLNPVHILKIEIAKTVTLQFEKTFSVDAATTEEFRRITESRKDVVAASVAQYSETAITGVNTYLPMLFGLMAAVDKLPPEFGKHLQIGWTTPLSSGYYHTEPKFHHQWLFEVIYVVTTFGILHRRLASEKLAKISEENFENFCQEPSKLLREAAGIFEYVAAHGCAKFFVPNEELPFPEIQSPALTMLSDISQAESQELFIKRGILSKKGPSALAKLCAGVASLYIHAKESHDKIIRPKYMELNPVLEKYIILKRDLFSAMAYKYQGILLYTSGSPGAAVAYLKKASTLANSLKYENIKGAPYNDDCFLFWKKCQHEIELINNIYTDFEKENSEIYHDKIDESQVEFPQAMHLAKSVPFEPPEKAIIQITPQAGCTIL